MQLPLLKVCGAFLSKQSKKTRHTFVCSSLFCISTDKNTKKNTACERQIYFVYVDIWFDLAKCKFIVKNSFKILVVFSPIFVADTKITLIITLVDNFVTPLKTQLVDY